MSRGVRRCFLGGDWGHTGFYAAAVRSRGRFRGSGTRNPISTSTADRGARPAYRAPAIISAFASVAIAWDLSIAFIAANSEAIHEQIRRSMRRARGDRAGPDAYDIHRLELPYRGRTELLDYVGQALLDVPVVRLRDASLQVLQVCRQELGESHVLADLAPEPCSGHVSPVDDLAPDPLRRAPVGGEGAPSAATLFVPEVQHPDVLSLPEPTGAYCATLTRAPTLGCSRSAHRTTYWSSSSASFKRSSRAQVPRC